MEGVVLEEKDAAEKGGFAEDLLEKMMWDFSFFFSAFKEILVFYNIFHISWLEGEVLTLW